MILSDKSYERFSDFEEIFNESFIKIDEAQKCLYFFQMSEFFSFHDDFDLFRIHFDFIAIDYHV
jgi:hypothetical protein